MFNLTKKQISDIKGFVKKLPDGIGRSNVETWLETAFVNDEAIRETELEKLKGFKPHMPSQLADFIDGWVTEVRTREATANEEFLRSGKAPEADKQKDESVKLAAKDETETQKEVSERRTARKDLETARADVKSDAFKREEASQAAKMSAKKK